MALTVSVNSPSLNSPMVLYRTGKPGALMESIAPIVRKSDFYTAQDVTASAGTWTTTLENSAGLFSSDGLFAQDLTDVTLVAAVDGTPVLVARPESVKEKTRTGRMVAVVRWRDVIDEWLSRSTAAVVPPLHVTGFLVASTTVHQAFAGYGLPTAGVRNLDLWYPLEATNVRRWLLPVIAGLGYQLDWSATYNDDTCLLSNVAFVLRPVNRFANSASLPVFNTRHVLGFGGPGVDDGRRQVVNAWSGSWRSFNIQQTRFENESINVWDANDGFYEYRYPYSKVETSRAIYGLRKSRLALDMLQHRVNVLELAGYIVRSRFWPHQRLSLALASAAAAALRIGDGLVLDLDLGTRQGRGLAAVCRVLGRSVDLLHETVTLDLEIRDHRDADYRHWYDAGRTTHAASEPT